jgi:glycosyltransferase involved in cell wall biosynthesis
MDNKNPKVLFVATSRQTMGGITSVIKRYEKMEIWKKYRCAWLETQVNKGIALKLWYMIKAYITMLFVVPCYDIIHFHTVPGRSITMQMPVFLYSLLWRKKTIIHIHVGNQLLGHLEDRMFNFVLRKASKVVVLANVLKDLMKVHYGIEAEVLYNPIEEQPLRDSAHIGKNIFFAAYLTLNKGYDTLLKAFQKVVVKHPDWKLVLAGSGETDNAMRLINEMGISNNVEMFSWLNKEQMAEKYKEAGIYCIASKMEGFPMAFLEAASYGVPIVTTPVGGIVDVIEHKENCMVFDFDDTDALAEHINALIESPALYDNISRNLVSLTQERFSLGAVDDKIDVLYRNI